MQRAEIDGVPVFWQQGSAPLSAVLMFRVGMRDEPFPRRGVTHLVEHLAMSRIGRRLHEFNASVGVSTTHFEATGPADAVAAYLADVCAALADLPVDRLATERKVLQVEGEGSGHGLVELHLLLRYGLRGSGLAAADPPAPDDLDADTVRDWVGRHFVRSAAALALTGPPPPGLRLPLPDGPPPPPSPVDPLPLGGPVWDEVPDDRGLALSFEVPAGEAAMAGARIALERLTGDLRHRDGLVYDVDLVLGSTAWSGGAGTVTLVADPPARSAAAVAAAVDATLRDLRDTGPTDAELAADLAEGRAVREDPRSALDAAGSAASAHLFGEDGDPAAAWADRLAVDAAAVRAAFARYPDTAILTVPAGVDPGLAGFARYPEHRSAPVAGREFARRRFGPVPRGGRLVVGEDGVSLVLREGTPTIRWADVVGYGAGPDGRHTLYGGDGCTIDLHPGFFKDGDQALALVEARVPAEARFVERDPGPETR